MIRSINIFLDVWGTLLTESGDPQPQAHEVFLRLTGMEHDVYLWSTAGEGYADYAAWVLGRGHVVRGCFGKSRVPENIQVDFVVDDHTSWEEEHGGYLVGAYEGHPWDRELLEIVEALDQGGRA